MSHHNEKGPKRVGDFLFPYSLCSKDLPMTAIALASVSQEDTTYFVPRSDSPKFLETWENSQDDSEILNAEGTPEWKVTRLEGFTDT